MKELAPSEQFEHLAEEVIAIRAQHAFNAGQELLQMRHEIGRAVIDHPLFKKNAKGQGKLIQELAARCEMGERSLRYAVEFATRFKTFDEVMALADPNHKLPAWREIVKDLPSGAKHTVEKQTCAHEWQCQKCGATRR